MFGWLKNKKKLQREQSAEDLRIERGKLAEKIIELDRKRLSVEDLMKRMLAEVNRGA